MSIGAQIGLIAMWLLAWILVFGAAKVLYWVIYWVICKIMK